MGECFYCAVLRAGRLYLRQRLAKIFKHYRVTVVEFIMYGNLEHLHICFYVWYSYTKYDGIFKKKTNVAAYEQKNECRQSKQVKPLARDVKGESSIYRQVQCSILNSIIVTQTVSIGILIVACPLQDLG